MSVFTYRFMWSIPTSAWLIQAHRFFYIIPEDRWTQNPSSSLHAVGQVLNDINAIHLRSLHSSHKILAWCCPASHGCQNQSLSSENLFLLQKSPHLLMQSLRSQVKQSAEAREMLFMHQDLVQATVLPLRITTSLFLYHLREARFFVYLCASALCTLFFSKHLNSL